MDASKNVTASFALLPVTNASLASGIYAVSKNVVLTTNLTSTIYYTTDGTTPTTSSAVYSSPIPINQTTTIKYFAVDSLGNHESVKTQRYTIIADGFIAVAGGDVHSLSIKSDGTLWAWGNNSFGQIGNGESGVRYTPNPDWNRH
jgi:hypothetical protein